MSSTLYWFGAIHAAVYAVGGALWLLSFIINRVIRRVQLMGELGQAYAIVLERRRTAKRIPG